ncbi:MAG: NAD(+) synthase [bacterium]
MIGTEQFVDFDAQKTAEDLAGWIRQQITVVLKRRGAMVGISGGIDSAVVAALCVQALGAQRVIGLALPERDSSPESLSLAQTLAARLEIQFLIEDISAGLDGMGAYQRRDEAVKRVFPDYRQGDKFKIALQSNPLQENSLNVFRLIMSDESGKASSRRLKIDDYLQIVAASNMKQRLRMTMLYYHAELRNYAVAGTGNKNEHDLGFFVKHGDGGSDLMPIGHLHKTQIYQLAGVLPIPQEIAQRTPTTDTYPAEVSQEEFFFRLPFATMDAIWHAKERGVAADEIAKNLNLEKEQVQRVIDDIDQKQRTTEYLRLPPLKVDHESSPQHDQQP